MRLQVLDTPFGFKIINDAYNANPDSMRRAVYELVRLKGAGKTIAVLGDMLELGEGSDREHYELGKYVCNSGVDHLICFGTFSSKTLQGYGNAETGLCAQTHKEAAKLLMQFANPGDLVLVKGSRGSKMEQVIKEMMKEKG